MRLLDGSLYLDANATTPLAPEAAESLRVASARHFANPSSAHAPGRAAREALDVGRASLSKLIGCLPEEVVFTSSGTEANHLAWASALSDSRGRRRVLISSIEHPSVSEQEVLWGGRFDVARVPVDGRGVLDLVSLGKMLSDDVALVSVMVAHNETGVIQPVAEAAGMARASGALFHTDAVQAAGKIPLPWEEASPDYLSVSGHKFYAPKGIGALAVRRDAPMKPMLVGGGQEAGRRSSTEAVPLVAALGTASELAMRGAGGERLSALRDEMEKTIEGSIGVVVHGKGAGRLPNTSFFTVPGASGPRLARWLDSRGIFVATGSACHGDSKCPLVLKEMGATSAMEHGALRVSLTRYTERGDLERFAAALVEAAKNVSE